MNEYSKTYPQIQRCLNDVRIFIQLFWIAGSLLGFISCSSSATKKIPVQLSGNGVTVRQIDKEEAERLHNPVIHETDWFIETPVGTLVVAGMHPHQIRRHPAGAIVGMYLNDHFSDNLTVLSIQGGSRSILQKWNVVSIAPKKRNGAVGLAISQVSDDNQLVVRTFIEYARRTSSFKIWSQIQNAGAAPLNDVTLGSNVLWDGGFIFSPGIGFIEKSINSEAAWLAVKGSQYTTALALRNKPYLAQYSFDPHGTYENTLIAAQTSLAPKESTSIEQHLFVSDGGIETIAEQAWKVAGIATGTLRGIISPMQSWGEVIIESLENKPILACSIRADGTFSIPIPFGNYETILVTPGGKLKQPASITIETPVTQVSFNTIPPGIVHFLVSDETLLPMPSRLIIRGLPPTEDPVLGPKHCASGAKNIMYSVKGAGEIELPEGRYRIIATHGPEYSIGEKEVHVKSARHVTINQVLQEEISHAGWLSADFHLHAEPSPDSDVSLADRVVSLFAENVNIAVATDHNTVTDYLGAVRQVNIDHSLYTGSGVEVTTWKPTWGHFNAWPWPTELPPPPWTGQTPKSIFAMIRQTQPDSILQVNHPRMDYHNIGYFTLAGLNLAENRFDKQDASFDFDAIEIYNGMDLKHPEIVEQNLSEWFALLNLGHKYSATGNSDSHFLVGHFAGYPRNYLNMGTERPEGYTIQDIADAVRAGRSFVSNGPFIFASIEEGTFGDEVSIKPNQTVNLTVSVQSASWLPLDYVTVIVNGEEITRVKIDAPANSQAIAFNFPLSFATDSWIVVKTGGAFAMNSVLPGTNAVPLAFSNPIWIHTGVPRTELCNAPSSLNKNSDTDSTTACERTAEENSQPAPAQGKSLPEH